MESHVRGVILEGLSYAGKTSTLKALKTVQSKYLNAERSILVLGEHYSQQLQIIHGEVVSLSVDEHIELLCKRISCIESLNAWAMYLGPASRRSRGLFYVLERFHLNHRFAYGSSEKIEKIEQRVCKASGVCFLLHVSPERIRERILFREKGNHSESEIDQLCEEWLLSQEQLVKASTESKVKTKIIETDKQEWETYASYIMDAIDS